MKALLIGHCVPRKSTTTAFFSLRSASAHVLPAVSGRVSLSIFLPTWAVGVSARAAAGQARAVARTRNGVQRTNERMKPPVESAAGNSTGLTLLGMERFHGGKAIRPLQAGRSSLTSEAFSVAGLTGGKTASIRRG